MEHELYDLEIVEEGKRLIRLKDGDIHLCHFKTFIKHKDRPGLVINRNGVGPSIMALGHIEPGDNRWMEYKQNKFVQDWNVSGLKLPTYANTSELHSLNDVNVYRKIGSLTDSDYENIVEPVISSINNDKLERLFEAFGYDFIYELIA